MTSKAKVFSVGELSKILQACFSNPAFQGIQVFGEVYSIRLGKFSYLEIGDQGKGQTSSPLLKCAFRTMYSDPYGLKTIKVGDVVKVTGNLSYYAHGSSLTLWGDDIELLQSQQGKSFLERKKTLEKLDKLGYLEPKRKRPIPSYCRKVAIITAKNSAAYSDIMKTLHERFPVSTVLFPATVQGEGAAKSMVQALERAKKGDFDCILLGRGGGSKTDLSCFDDEKLSLEIATSPIPVITCIGHTIDTAIADMVSDVKAITPTEGASLINPSLEDVKKRREEYFKTLVSLFEKKVDEKYQEAESFQERLVDLSPLRRAKERKDSLQSGKKTFVHLFLSRLTLKKEKVVQRRKALEEGFDQVLAKRKVALSSFLTRLEAFSPEYAKERGYALLIKNGKRVVSAKELQKGDKAVLTYYDGRKDIEIQ